MRYKNIVFIGMAGSGKSKLGMKVAEKIGYSFIDTDRYIESMEGITLDEIMKKYGNTKFKEIEEKRILEIHLCKYVISTGGSAVYSQKAMEHLKKGGIIVYLSKESDFLKRKIKNMGSRAIVGFDGKNFDEIYEERKPLYEKYADITVDGECSVEELVEIISSFPISPPQEAR